MIAVLMACHALVPVDLRLRIDPCEDMDRRARVRQRWAAIMRRPGLTYSERWIVSTR